MTHSRPPWDEYFMSITREVARRSTCLRRQVGAILVRGKRILATGYNGAPTGLKHCLEIGCLREESGVPPGERHELCRGLHAEMNVFLQCALYGIATEASTLYATAYPCALCAKMIINARVKRVVVGDEYPDKLAKALLQEGGIPVEHIIPP